MNFTSMNTAEIQQGLKAGDFSAREVAQASIDHIAKADASVHAYLEFTPEAALAAAELVDNALAAGNFDELGPLAGVPVAFKDNMNMEGTHTTFLPTQQPALIACLHRVRCRSVSSIWTNSPSAPRLKHLISDRRATRGIWSACPVDLRVDRQLR